MSPDPNTALAMIWYAVALNFIGLRAANWAKSMGLNRVTLMLDPLPGANAVAMNLVRRISEESELGQLWVRTIESTEVSFRIGNLISYKPAKGEPECAGKVHPHAVLVDWIAHSLFASFEGNQNYFLDKHAGRKPEEKDDYLAAVKEPWFWLYKKNRGLLIPLESLVSSAPEEALTPGSDSPHDSE